MDRLPELTRNQSLVFDVLRRAKGPMSAYNIQDDLRGEGVRAPLQVYRALDLLLEFGVVHRLESKNAFVVCSQMRSAAQGNMPCGHGNGVTAFAICEDCGEVVEFLSEAVQARLREWAKAHAFEPTKATLEITGHCANCADRTRQ